MGGIFKKTENKSIMFLNSLKYINVIALFPLLTSELALNHKT